MKQRINSGSPRGLLMKGGRDTASARRALAQPRFLLAAMALALAFGGATYLATAQTGHAPVKMTTAKSSSTLSKLPAMVEAYGQARVLAASKSGSANAKSSKGLVKAAVVGSGNSGFNLVETDLTSAAVSDEREPTVSPSGEYIAFASDRVVAADGTITRGSNYHLWLMNRDGSGVRQLTGFSDDVNYSQRRPSWSPDGNQLVYVTGSATGQQIYVISPFVDANSSVPDIQPQARQRTFYLGDKEAPSWSPSGTIIAFSTNADPFKSTSKATVTLKSYDIYTVTSNGTTFNRLTGVNSSDTTGDNDAIGDNTDDFNPAFSLVNPGVVFFSSNRDQNTTTDASTVLSQGRRIWSVDATGITAPRQITDPSQRSADSARVSTVVDDFPAPSIDASAAVFGAASEQLAFQTNSYLDASDRDSGKTPDVNIWSLSVDSNVLAPTVTTVQEPLAYVSSYNGNQVLPINTETEALSDTVPAIPVNGTSQTLSNPEGVILTNNEQYLVVSNRGQNRLDRYDAVSGEVIPGAALGNSFTGEGSVPQPSDLVSDGSYIYVSSGKGATAVYRFTNVDALNEGGEIAPTDPKGTTGAFTSGDAASPVTGCEGIDYYGNLLYVCSLFTNKINIYDKTTGKFLSSLTPAGLSFPTGIKVIPDQDGDDNPDILVCSSGNDSVLLVSGPVNAFPFSPDPLSPDGASGGGTVIRTIVADNDGAVSGLNAPEGIFFVPGASSTSGDIYVSSFRDEGDSSTRTLGAGYYINRYDLATGNPEPRDSNHAGARWLVNNAIYGTGYFTFNSTALGAIATPVSTSPIEDSSTAKIVTNVLSSPTNYAASELGSGKQPYQNVKEDQAADVEPAYSRSTNSVQLASRLVFASTRVYAGTPASNQGTATSVRSNTASNDGNGTAVTYDIWSASTLDRTPPVLIPQGSGNVPYPVAPVPSTSTISTKTATSLFPPPRTYDDGIRPAIKSGNTGSYKFAVVLRELESGINPGEVTVTYYRAGRENFDTSVQKVDGDIQVNVADEVKADPLPGFINMPLAAYDDGPPTATGTKGGHELQADAVAGDGVYYCYADLPTPNTADDYYVTVTVRDRQFNQFTYDNIWGFTTKPFVVNASAGNDLFVSDYTAGQDFPGELNTGDFGISDDRFANMPPVESYYLNNPGGTVVSDGLKSDTTTLPSVDVWRILCRGAVPASILSSYRPTLVSQIDPNDATGKYVAKTRSVPVSNNAVIWASPYARTSFAGPGSITDPDVQTTLTGYLAAGGRLMLTGRDILWGLTSAGTETNTFLTNEMEADYSDETTSTTLSTSGQFQDDFEIAYRTAKGPGDTSSYGDASYNQWAAGSFPSNQMDIIKPAGGDTTSLYTTTGKDRVGQLVVRNRGGDVESRVVFLSFGFEAVNRKYVTSNGVQYPYNVRVRAANEIRRYFKTGSVQGTIINDATNKPIPNFLVEVIDDFGHRYFARTDAGGIYSILGLPQGDYEARPAQDSNGNLLNAGYFGGTDLLFPINVNYSRTNPVGYPNVPTGDSITGVNFRVIPVVPSSLSGTAVIDTKTPPTPANNVSVLIVSEDELSTGGYFARLTRTDADGNFSFDSIPSRIGTTDVKYRVIFNPKKSDIPDGSGITFDDSDVSAGGDRRTDLGRRVVPDNRRPADIVISPGNNYYLNDTDPTKYKDPDATPAAADNDTESDSGIPILIPTGPSIYGQVTFNGAVVPNAVVQLLDSSGKVLRTQTTPSSGNYSFSNVTANATKSTSYKVHATGSVLDGVTGSNTIAVTIPAQTNGVVDIEKDVPLLLFSATGTVTYNGVGISGIVVQLLNSDGTVFVPKRSTSTNSSGVYTLKNLPAGTYIIKATKGVVSGQVPITVSESNISTNPAKAKTINLFIANVSGKVTYNGKATSGIVVQLLNSDGTPLSPTRSTKTDSSGAYSFTTVASGNYLVKAIQGDATGQVKVTVSGSKNATAATINLYVLQISGKVTYNGTLVSGAIVQLFNSDGTVVSTTRTVKTNSSGAYVLANVLPGSYVIKATQGSAVGQVTVTVTTKDITAPTIALLTHELTGTVVVKVDGASKGTAVKGALVELLNSSGASLSPAVTTTTDSSGMYTFDDVVAGQYKVRASYKGDVTISSTFTMKASQTTGPTLTLYLQSLTVKVINSAKAVQSGVAVQLKLNGGIVQMGTTKSNGLFTFTDVAAASPSTTYTIVAIKGNAAGTADVAVRRGRKPNVVTIELIDPTVNPSNPTSFNVKNRIYAISIPYEDASSPSSSNVSEKTGNVSPAVTKVKNAFTVPPIDPTTHAQNYILQRFDPTTLSYVDLGNDDLILRGFGYLLQVVQKGTDLKLPANDPTRIPLRDSSTEKLFTVTLHLSSSSKGNDANGRNLIGYGFNPAKYSSVDWDTAQVYNPVTGETVQSIGAAVSKGWMSGQITTLQSSGSTSATVEVSDLKPYGGYYVQTYVDGLKVTFRNPKAQ